MRHCNNAVRGDEGCLHDVHVLSPNRIVQAEEILVMARNLHWVHFSHGTSALVCNVVNHKDTPRIGQLVVLPVMNLCSNRSGLNDNSLLNQMLSL